MCLDLSAIVTAIIRPNVKNMLSHQVFGPIVYKNRMQADQFNEFEAEKPSISWAKLLKAYLEVT